MLGCLYDCNNLFQNFFLTTCLKRLSSIGTNILSLHLTFEHTLHLTTFIQPSSPTKNQPICISLFISPKSYDVSYGHVFIFYFQRWIIQMDP
jgi:hypothetical protein